MHDGFQYSQIAIFKYISTTSAFPHSASQSLEVGRIKFPSQLDWSVFGASISESAAPAVKQAARLAHYQVNLLVASSG